jgi:hypothetical protein
MVIVDRGSAHARAGSANIPVIAMKDRRSNFVCKRAIHVQVAGER